MKIKSLISHSLFLMMLAAALTGYQPALAQTTSSELRGLVTAGDGRALAGAEVEITHLPSSTVARTSTGETGQFFRGGLRVGGPYEIRVTADGYQGTSLDNVFLQPGSQDPLRIALDSAMADIETLVITGTRVQEAVELNKGVGSSYSARDIANQPAINRDVLKTLVRDPLAHSDGVGHLSVAGANPRFNGLSINGSLQQDDFGLGSNTYATERSPINLDIVESATLVASDYSVTASGFTGGLVNVVTRSGSNEWDGALYYSYKDDSFIGEKYKNGGRFEPGDFEEKEYGFFLSGPIVKDKLFFLFSYDEYEIGDPFDFSNADEQAGRDPAIYDALGDIIRSTYGYDPLARPLQGSIPTTSERTFAKLDWNINESHRASFSYQKTEESGSSISASDFESAWYDIPTSLEAYNAELFSDWTYNFSTTLRVNYKEFERGQNCRAGAGTGHFEFVLDPDDVTGTPLDGLLNDRETTIVAGCDRFRHANEYSDDRLQLFASADWLVGDHVLTFGSSWEELNLFNLFVAGSDGRFVFENYDQIINRTPNNVDYVNVQSNNRRDGAAAWGYNTFAAFVQDTWSITPDFELNYGLRYERFLQDDEPAFSEEIFDTYGVRTDNNLDGLDLFMPRVGFLWTPWDRTSISGGFGLYAGGNPQVWVSNAFQAPTVFARATDVTDADIFTVPQELLDAVAAAEAGVPIDYIGEDFEMPSDWKASLKFEKGFDMDFGGFSLGHDWRFTAQYLYTRANKGFHWENLAQTELADALPTGVAPDGRPIYADLDALGINNMLALTNHDEGESHVLTLGLGKVWDSGVNFDISYAHQDIEMVTEGGSSRGISNWRGIFDSDRNFPSARTSLYQIEDAFKLNLGYETPWSEDWAFRADLFGQYLSGDVWGAAFDISNSNSLFGRAGQGEGPFDNNPLYVPDPAGDSRVVYASDFDEGGFFEYVDEHGLPTGKIMAPYSKTSDNNMRWDLRLQQSFPGIPGFDRFVGDNRFKLILDIENFLNLLNKDWGVWKNGPGFGQQALVQADLVSAADVAEHGIDDAAALTGDAARTACQSEGDCVYRFNDFFDRDTSFDDGARSVYQIRLTLRYEF